MTEINLGNFDEERAIQIETAATDLFIAVWRAIQDGRIPDRGQIDDAALQLRDILNPDYIENPDWLPESLASELGHVATSFHETTEDDTAPTTEEPVVDDSNMFSESLLDFGQKRQTAVTRTAQLLATNRNGSRRQRQWRNSRRRWA
jgi:hypothetical protein